MVDLMISEPTLCEQGVEIACTIKIKMFGTVNKTSRSAISAPSSCCSLGQKLCDERWRRKKHDTDTLGGSHVIVQGWLKR